MRKPTNGAAAAYDLARTETLAEPVTAQPLPPTAEERVAACKAAIDAALTAHGCQLVPSWVQVSQIQQVRSEHVLIEALPDWKPQA